MSDDDDGLLVDVKVKDIDLDAPFTVTLPLDWEVVYCLLAVVIVYEYEPLERDAK